MSLTLLKYTLNDQSCILLNLISQIEIDILSIYESSRNPYPNISKGYSKFLSLPSLFDGIIPLKMFVLFEYSSFSLKCKTISFLLALPIFREKLIILYFL